MAKHFELVIAEAIFSFHRKDAAIAAEALDCIYVVRTNRPRKALGDAAAQEPGPGRACVPVLEDRRRQSASRSSTGPRPGVRAHVLLCMLAYHVEQHRRARLAPMLYAEVNHDAAAAMRPSVVARAERSNVCQAQADNPVGPTTV